MTLKSPHELAAAGLLAPHDIRQLEAVAQRYAVAITPAVARLIDTTDPADPIARQFVPTTTEATTRLDELSDPIGDDAHSPRAGIVHRYPDRVLLKPTGVCPVYCRYCFRREMVGPANAQNLDNEQLSAALGYIADHSEIWEVIITGGDPLILSPRRIAHITDAIATIPHVDVIRWHSRVPVVAPETITQERVAALKTESKAVWIALHANHPREFSPEARAAIARLVDVGIPMVSQSVLLRGINDDAETLGQLMRTFVANRIKPYYLHHLDRAPGTAHFRVPIAEGQQLARDIQGNLSGLCQPTYVLDLPDGHGKVPIGPVYAQTAEAGEWWLTDYTGCRRGYQEGP